jgi:hypothetical protein
MASSGAVAHTTRNCCTVDFPWADPAVVARAGAIPLLLLRTVLARVAGNRRVHAPGDSATRLAANDIDWVQKWVTDR